MLIERLIPKGHLCLKKSTGGAITLFIGSLLFLFVRPSYANPIMIGFYGQEGIELYFLATTVLIEFAIIALLIRTNLKLRLLGGVIRIHLLSFPLTIIFAIFFRYFAEIIPLIIEPLYFVHLFNQYKTRGLLSVLPSGTRIVATVIIANLITFSLGIGFAPHLRNIASHEHRKATRAAIAEIAVLEQGLDRYKLDTGNYPTTSHGLAALIEDPGIKGWNGPYIKKSLVYDPWKEPFHYEAPGKHGNYDLFSYGADKLPGGAGENADITSWEP